LLIIIIQTQSNLLKFEIIFSIRILSLISNFITKSYNFYKQKLIKSRLKFDDDHRNSLAKSKLIIKYLLI